MRRIGQLLDPFQAFGLPATGFMARVRDLTTAPIDQLDASPQAFMPETHSGRFAQQAIALLTKGSPSAKTGSSQCLPASRFSSFSALFSFGGSARSHQWMTLRTSASGCQDVFLNGGIQAASLQERA